MRATPMLVFPLLLPINMDMLFFQYGLFFYACEVRLFCYFLHCIALQSLGSRPNEGKPAFVSFPRVCFKFDAHRRSSTSIAHFSQRSVVLRVVHFSFVFVFLPRPKQKKATEDRESRFQNLPSHYHSFFSYLFCHPTRSEIKSKKVRS